MTTATSVPCLICRQPLSIRLAKGRKSGKVFVMLLCTIDARHFRGFINDRAYVDSVLALLEGQTPSLEGGADLDSDSTPDNPSKTIVEGPAD